MKRILAILLILCFIVNFVPEASAEDPLTSEINVEEAISDNNIDATIWTSNIDGMLLVKENTSWAMNIPETVSAEDVNVIIFHNGYINGGLLFATQSADLYAKVEPDAVGWYQEQICDYMAADNPDCVCVAMRKTYGDADAVKEVFDFLDSIGVKSYNNIVVAGWSDGGAGVLVTTSAIAEDSDINAKNLYMIMADCNHTESYDSLWQICAEYNIPVIYLNRDSDLVTLRQHHLSAAMNSGIIIYTIGMHPTVTKRESYHTDLKRALFEDNVFRWVIDPLGVIADSISSSRWTYASTQIFMDGEVIESTFDELADHLFYKCK